MPTDGEMKPGSCPSPYTTLSPPSPTQTQPSLKLKYRRPKGFRPAGRVRRLDEPVTCKVSHKILYDEYPHHYHLLATRQDKDHNIEKHLRETGLFLPTSTVLELGAGSGKLSCIVAPWVKHVKVTDISMAMLEVAEDSLVKLGIAEDKWDIERVDVRDECWSSDVKHFDVVLAGWCISYVKSQMWSSPDWEAHLDKVLIAIRRVLKPGGSILLLETLGTGSEEPTRLGGWYHNYLKERGFAMTWFRTDYLFHSVEEAAMLSRFFWGKHVASDCLPECTALWRWTKTV